MPLLAQFGAGNIGRSLVGQLFARAGWEVVFLDVNESVIAALNARHSYTVEIHDDDLPAGAPVVLEVNGVSGVPLREHDAVLNCLARADLVGTSVGAANLPSVCKTLAAAAALRGHERARSHPLPVLLCENLHGAGGIACAYLRESGGNSTEDIAFVEAAISTMVPLIPAAVREGLADPLTVWAEAYTTLYLDADAYPGTPPVVPGVAWRGDFAAYVDRKLFLHNYGHAAAAYFGFLAGKTAIWECVASPALRAEVAACMTESARGLARRYANVFTFDENRAWLDDLLRRFGNRSLGDTVFRVGRDLKRKYARDDRMLGTLRLLRDEGVPYAHTARAVAAGLRFAAADESGNAHPGDSDVVALAREKGVREALMSVGQLDPVADTEIIEAVAEAYKFFA